MDPRSSEDFAAFVSARQSSARSTAARRAPEPALHAVEGGLSTATSSRRGPWSRLLEAGPYVGAGGCYPPPPPPPHLLPQRLGGATPRRPTEFDALARHVRTTD